MHVQAVRLRAEQINREDTSGPFFHRLKSRKGERLQLRLTPQAVTPIRPRSASGRIERASGGYSSLARSRRASTPRDDTYDELAGARNRSFRHDETIVATEGGYLSAYRKSVGREDSGGTLLLSAIASSPLVEPTMSTPAVAALRSPGTRGEGENLQPNHHSRQRVKEEGHDSEALITAKAPVASLLERRGLLAKDATYPLRARPHELVDDGCFDVAETDW